MATIDASLRRAGGCLARAEGHDLHLATDAILKGILESEVPVGRLVGPPRPPFLPLFRRLDEPGVEALFDRHGCERYAVGDAARATTLASRTPGGRGSVLLLSNDQLFYAMPALQALGSRETGPLAIVVEDNPALAPAAAPRRLMADLGVPCLEPHDVESLRDMVEIALRLGRAASKPAAIVVDVGRLRSLDTLEARPNRIVDRVDEAAAARRGRRVPRGTADGGDLMRLARRLELNVASAMPSPGERGALGLLVAGNALQATRHLLADVGLEGQVPVVGLGLTNPLDDALVLRVLLRCDAVVVLENRPGGLAASLAEIVERSRGRGESPASLWWSTLPVDEHGEERVLEPGDATSPSRLARKLLHLLHPIRPTLRVAARLASVPEAVASLPVPARGEGLGFAGASARVREVLGEIDRELRRGTDGPSTGLSIDGFEPSGSPARVVPIEIWDRKRFAFEGPAAVRQAMRSRAGRVMIVCDLAGEDEVDVARLARAAVPAEPDESLAVVVRDVHDRAGLREALLDASRLDRLTVLVARDGPPPRLDPIAAERALADVDRLGFAPRQRVVFLAESACELGGSTPAPLADPPPVRTRGWIRKLRIRAGAAVRVRVRPFLEQVDAIRSKPPAGVRGDDARGVSTPRPIHAASSRWRAHLAGYRGGAPGVAAQILCEAGRVMGYRVRAVWDPTPIGPGRRAWAQVLFTSAGRGEEPPLEAAIPQGEADLLLGLDPIESLRAVGPDPWLRVASPDRTHAVINSAALAEAGASDEAAAALPSAIRRTCVAGTRVEDLLAPCRTAFLTERVLDVVLLGCAYQRGLVPVSPEAIVHALRLQEERGVGRCVDAFAFGRRLAGQVATEARPSSPPEAEPVPRAMRRIVRGAARRGGRGGERISQVLRDALSAMPGLLESEAGRRAAAEFAECLAAAVMWGGVGHAARYADRIRRLYAVDRGETGRELTRIALAPIAEAMLVRDLFHVAAMSLSPRHLANLRSTLRVRSARGDRVERRFLFRLDALGFGRRFRLDLRTSDWLPIVLARVARFWPWRWRGTPRERALREAVLARVEQAIVELGSAEADDETYRGWVAEFRRMRAGDRRLRGPAVITPTVSASPGARREGAAPSRPR